jgi:hypothetical protein
MKLIKPTLEDVNNTDLSPLFTLFKFFPEVTNGDKNYLDQPAGIEHYKLLGWISNQFNDSIISEIGTCDGMGLLALSLNKNNTVISYDIMDYDRKHDVPVNGKRVICDKVFNFFDDVVKSEVIFYDGGHRGPEEIFFVKQLINLNYKGVIIFDDINLCSEMRHFWNEVKNLGLYTEDWTDIGHYEGTGIIFFNNK